LQNYLKEVLKKKKKKIETASLAHPSPGTPSKPLHHFGFSGQLRLIEFRYAGGGAEERCSQSAASL
jgi:hypothetical protein